MIDKVKKYLLRHNQINIYKKNESGSEYFRVGNSIIRVSDHVATSRNDPDTLNIVVCGDNFIVMFGNKIINVNDYNAFKSFLKYHIQMCDYFKDLINKGLGRTSKDYVSKPSKKNYSSEDCLPYIIYKDERIDISNLTEAQRASTHSMHKHNCFPRRESLIKHLQHYDPTIQ